MNRSHLGAIWKYIVCAALTTPIVFTHSIAAATELGSPFNQQDFTGKVTNKQGQPLVGATVKNVNSGQTSTTDSSGNFTLKGKSTDMLEITYTGYEKLFKAQGSAASSVFILADQDTQLEEVVVMGYNSLKETNISGSVSRVDMTIADKRRVQDVSQLLQGQATGVNVTQSTGQPGDAIDIRIRGVGTIGNNSPLFIVDGVPTTNFSFINPADIASMSVLKDASAASIYGSRAAAGVILVTTKKGVSGKTKFDVNLYTGINQAVNLPKMMNSTDYLNTVE